MSNTFEGAVSINANGTTLTSTSVSSSAAIPVDASGNVPRYVRIVATAAAYVKLGIGSATATTSNILVQPSDSILLHIPSGVTHIAAIRDTADGKVNVCPMDNV